MYYKTPAELRARRNAGRSGGDGARWSNYGDPGATYPGPDGAVAHYNYLLWNLPRTTRGLLPGGGIIEAILPAGTLLSLCAGQRLRLPAFDVRGARNGHVDFGYAKVRGATPAGGSYAIYGWVLLGYRYAERPYVATVTRAVMRCRAALGDDGGLETASLRASVECGSSAFAAGARVRERVMTRIRPHQRLHSRPRERRPVCARPPPPRN